MKQIVFVSGKGGTGKSTLVASLSHLINNKMLADCDVDAPNLHLLLKENRLQTKDYSGANVAQIDSTMCVQCGMCLQVCRFQAISANYQIIPTSCEGCAACTVRCPTEAIQLMPVKTGESYISQTDLGTFAHARLEIGAEGSGKLVTEVRKSLFEFQHNEDWVLIDGSPGIGCVVIASITGTDAVVAVSEPTQSGQHDLLRVIDVARHFKVPAFVCINKYDLNPDVSQAIEQDCMKLSVPVICKIPYEPKIVSALQQGLTPVEAGIDTIVEPIKSLWQNLVGYFDNEVQIKC